MRYFLDAVDLVVAAVCFGMAAAIALGAFPPPEPRALAVGALLLAVWAAFADLDRRHSNKGEPGED